MTARSTGMFDREGFSLGSAVQVDGFGGGTVDVLGRLEHARTIRIIAVGFLLEGDATIQVQFDDLGSIIYTFTAADASLQNGVFIGHIRGALLRGKTQDVGYFSTPNTGSVAESPKSGVFLELLNR